MAVCDVDVVVFVKQIPEVWFEDGHFHAVYKSGKSRWEFVFSPNTFLRLRLVAGAVVNEFHEAANGTVVPVGGAAH